MSREVNNWVMLLMGTILIGVFSPHVLAGLTEFMRTYLEKAHILPLAPGGLSVTLGYAYFHVLAILGVPLFLLMVAAFLSPFVQIGPLFCAETIKPSIKKVSLIQGFKRLFSMRSLMEFAKGIFKLALIGVVGVIILYPYFDKFEYLIGLSLLQVMEELQALVVRLMIGVLVVLFVIAMIDLIYQRYEHYKKMRMTKQEVKDEYKQTEGDPQVKAKLRQLRSERARQRMMQNVPEADVVITNPTHYSIALKYDPEEMSAPLCVAKGIDEVALRIREIARDNGVILYENKPLARTLFDTVEIDEMIPQEHYQAVAEIISFVFKTRKQKA